MRKFSEKLKSPVVVGFLLANLVFSILIGLRISGTLQPVELLAYDFGLRIRPAQPLDHRVVLIGFTESDIHAFGYPASDELLARILEKLTDSGARAIGVDIYRDIPVPPGSARFAAILKRNPDIVWITKLGRKENRVLPPKLLENTDQVGFNDMVDDPGGKIRRGMLFMDDGKDNYTSFALQLALHYLAPLGVGLRPDPANPDEVMLGKTLLPPFLKNDGGYSGADDAGYQFLMDYAGMPKRFPRYSFGDLLSGRASPSLFKGKIVILGSMANSVNDFFYTPFSEQTNEQHSMFGVEFHGFATSQLLRIALDGAQPVRIFADPVEEFWIWCWVLLGASTGYFVRSLRGFLATAAAALSLLFLAFRFSAAANWWIPTVPPAIGYVIAAAVVAAYMANQLHLKSQFIRKTFGRYMSDEVVEKLLESPDGLELGGKSLEVTVVFSDLRGFSAISEAYSPEAVVGMLNDYLKVMTEVIFKYQGTINEFMGDGILILFGAPTMREDDADRAIACCIEMQQAMKKVNGINREKGLPELEMGLGLNTGRVVAGNVGSDMRVKYSVVGSNVNLASRVESFTVGGQILVTRSTLEAMKSEAVVRNHFSVSFKGIREPVDLYEISGIRGKYRLDLPDQDENPAKIDPALEVLLDLLEGKQSSGKTVPGRITHSGKKSAFLAAQIPLEPLSNLRISTEGCSAQAYAKVMALREGIHEIRFTSVPEEFAAMLEKACRR